MAQKLNSDMSEIDKHSFLNVISGLMLSKKYVPWLSICIWWKELYIWSNWLAVWLKASNPLSGYVMHYDLKFAKFGNHQDNQRM